MKRLLLTVFAAVALQLSIPAAWAQAEASRPAAAGDESGASSTSGTADSAAANTAATTAAAAAVTAERMAKQPEPPPDLLEHLVDVILDLFNVGSSTNTFVHYGISMLFLVAALLARKIVTGILFVWLRKLASRTSTTLDDKLFPAMEAPAAAFIMITGIFGALKVLKLTPESDVYIDNGSTVAFSLVVFWGLWRGFGAILDHAQEVALEKQLGIAAFMPWIKKSLLTMFVVIGLLLTIQSLGYDVKALLAGLGIGGLAFALAAQDTIANVFGSIVVATDQPFKLGEAIRISGNVGIVEDIGLRSTRIRLMDKSLMVIPNKTVAGEMITNFSRFTRRRVEQVIGLTYDSPPEKLDAIVQELRQLISSQPEVDAKSVMVFFRDFSASSLDLWVVYETPDPDFQKHMAVRQRLNLAIMKTIDARGLSMAFPTQTIQLDGPVARKLADGLGERPSQT